MTFIDTLLRHVGLMRISRQPFKEFEIKWCPGKPTHVDLTTRHGPRVVGYVDPDWEL